MASTNSGRLHSEIYFYRFRTLSYVIVCRYCTVQDRETILQQNSRSTNTPWFIFLNVPALPESISQLDGLCFLVAYQLNSLFIFMIFLFDVQLRNKYDDDNCS